MGLLLLTALTVDTKMDSEDKLVSMIMEANQYVRYTAICDTKGEILWNSHRNDVNNILTLYETKTSLKRSIDTWKTRDELSSKIGKGQYAIVAYDKIKRITIPLPNNHMLFVSVEGKKPAYIKDILSIVDYVQKNPI